VTVARRAPYHSFVNLINPATEQVIGPVVDHSSEEIARKLSAADAAFVRWRALPMSERGARLRDVAKTLRARAVELAGLMTREMGKPITAAEAEVEKCAACCDHFAEHAAAYLAPQTIPSDATRSVVRFDPLGAVFAIMPWNFPFWQVFRFACPTLMAGNVGVLKHAPNVPGCALAIESVFKDAGFLEGVFTTLLISDNGVAADVIRHDGVKAVTLTGSTRAGKSVAATAGSVLKKVVLELGGSDPFIVLADADVESVARQAAAARCINSGQSCIAAKRFIVERPIAAAFERAFAEAMRSQKVGDPTDRATQVGPLAREDLRDTLADQVKRSLKAGARLVTGGKRLDRKGYFFEPTVLADVAPGNPAFDEETFGPVAALVVADDADDAVRLANQSIYGLGASIWTRDAMRGEALAPRIEAGCVFVNGIVKSDPRLPFGGIKQSGYGRELASFGIHEFVNVKTVWVKA
jgi:succinate-semialdehyde dehydrogenase/glutarate-semialdehyde dehydrogenase